MTKNVQIHGFAYGPGFTAQRLPAGSAQPPLQRSRQLLRLKRRLLKLRLRSSFESQWLCQRYKRSGLQPKHV